MSRSVVWKYFDIIEGTLNARCSICQAVVMTCKNTTNLFSHMKNRHPVQYSALIKERQEGQSLKRKHGQPTLATFMSSAAPYDTNSPKKTILDASLIWMIVKDMQPVRIVEDEGFQNFVNKLDPKYNLPSRRTIMREMLPTLYRNKKENLLVELQKASYISITTDIWTSNQTQAFLSVTAHYVCNDTKMLNSAVLKTAHLTTSHTAEYISNELRAVFDEYAIMDKIVAIVSDNAANMTAAVRQLSVRHLPCFAHTLNLIVRAAIRETDGVVELQRKVKRIVELFHRSVNASDRLREVQQQQEAPELKLINDVETRWNSTLSMFTRFMEIKDSVATALVRLGKGTLCLSDEELEVIKEVIVALKPFLNATEEMSAEKTTTLSKVIPLAKTLLAKSKSSTTPLAKSLEKQMLAKKFDIFESFHPLNVATLLDPRFKKIAFKDIGNLEQAKTKLIDEVTSLHLPTLPRHTEPQPSTSTSPDDLWDDFDADVIASTDQRSSEVNGHLEMRRYLEDVNVPRTDNPFVYWEANSQNLKMLSEMAKKYLSIPATSVPSERLFSKAGELISLKRNRIKPKNVDRILFLNNCPADF